MWDTDISNIAMYDISKNGSLLGKELYTPYWVDYDLSLNEVYSYEIKSLGNSYNVAGSILPHATDIYTNISKKKTGLNLWYLTKIATSPVVDRQSFIYDIDKLEDQIWAVGVRHVSTGYGSTFGWSAGRWVSYGVIYYSLDNGVTWNECITHHFILIVMVIIMMRYNVL